MVQESLQSGFIPKWVGVYFQGLSKQRLILLQRESSLKSWRFFPNPSFPLLFEVLLAFAEKEENPQLHLSRWLCVYCAAMSSRSHNSFKGTLVFSVKSTWLIVPDPVFIEIMVKFSLQSRPWRLYLVAIFLFRFLIGR